MFIDKIFENLLCHGDSIVTTLPQKSCNLVFGAITIISICQLRYEQMLFKCPIFHKKRAFFLCFLVH